MTLEYNFLVRKLKNKIQTEHNLSLKKGKEMKMTKSGKNTRRLFYEVCEGSSGVIHHVYWKAWDNYRNKLVMDNISFSFKKRRMACVICDGCGAVKLPEFTLKTEMNGNEYNHCAKCHVDVVVKRYNYTKEIPEPRWGNTCELCKYCGQIILPIKFLGVIVWEKVIDIYGHINPSESPIPVSIYATEKKTDVLLQSKYPELYSQAKALWNNYCKETYNMQFFIAE